jgi:hypothetical protein
MLVKMVELDWDSPEAHARFESMEEGYRRGFTQGYSRAMDDALELGVKRESKWWQEMAVFFDKKLMRWRSSRVGASMDHPPSFTHIQ